MLTAQEIRQRYLDFFHRHAHEIVRSGPLIPPDDKTLLFTNAGMVQFKKLFLGAEKRSYSRATTCQKCLRVSGKHNDLENVGRTARHHTFFEMLGNFSFGDYFKKEAITWAWQFVTEELELPSEKLWVTIYRDDDEAFQLWKEISGLADERIVRMDEKDNFWTMGDTGPCGPCSEIYIDQGSDMACGPNCGIGSCDCDRFLEIWNLVFTQFDQAQDGSRSLLKAPNIDTGMGLERIAAVCQGKRSNFDCDLFQTLIQYAAELAHVRYSFSQPDTNDVDTALRVIADHSRAAAFLICEGVLPSNESRGYVLRRLIRRALRFASLLGVREPFMHKVVGKVVEVMGDAYPELREQADFIARVVYEEEERFSLTLENGLRLLEARLSELEASGSRVVPGDFCFLLHDTHGFPLDIITDVAGKRGFSADEKGFAEHMAKQRERARASQKKGGLFGGSDGQGVALEERFKRLCADGEHSEFTGYDSLTEETTVGLLLNGVGEKVQALGEGEEGYVIVPKTPFYGESGGQVGDRGTLSSLVCKAVVQGTMKPAPTLIVHALRIERGELHAGEHCTLSVDESHRLACARNHSVTHLLHAALRTVLGTHVHQMGSLVNGERLRFDFSHISALTNDELRKVEEWVNNAIMADVPVRTTIMDREQAKQSGAMALFDEKYGDTVRVVSMGDGDAVLSCELCGGTHLTRTGQAGSFIIEAESGVASGTRRIEALTGTSAYEMVRRQRDRMGQVERLLKTSGESLVERVEALQSEVKKLRKQESSAKVSAVDARALLEHTEEIAGIRLLCVKLDAMPLKAMRTLMDDVRSHLTESSVVCLCGVEGERLSLLLYVSKDLHSRLKAPDLIRPVAELLGGSGGGRPDLAQAGGNNPGNIPLAFAELKKLLAA
ncbi:MAG: alanine--tRNA ligase [Desulfovibrio sp.]|nr:alanine--tRNA ligase [Desulfovibrio sp.]